MGDHLVSPGVVDSFFIFKFNEMIDSFKLHSCLRPYHGVCFFFFIFFNAFSDIFVLLENRVCSSYLHSFLRNFVVFANQISKDRLTLRSGWRGSLGHRNA